MKKRWLAAQSFEDSVWSGAGHADDRNQQHSSMFGNYLSLKSYINKFGNYGEIGCGPFTQTTTIFSSLNIKKEVNSITLVDPLLRSYLKNVAHCTYKTGQFLGFSGSKLNLVSAGGEQITYMKNAFDTVTMMNVLEHVMDAYLVLQNYFNSVKKGGIIIFSERWYDFKFDILKQNKQAFWDLGHPVNVKKYLIEIMLNQFETIYRNDFARNQLYPTDDGTYFIGIKK